MMTFRLGLVLLLCVGSTLSVPASSAGLEEGTCLADGSCVATDNRSEDLLTATLAATEEIDDDENNEEEEEEEFIEEDEEEELGEDDFECSDENEHCQFWASEGECNANPSYMHQYCMKSCRICTTDR